MDAGADADDAQRPTEPKTLQPVVPPMKQPVRTKPSKKTSKRSAVTHKVQTHLDAATKAKHAGNSLEQMAHADSALRLAPKNTQAAYLLGDALLTSDKTRACKYLHRARRLSKARKAYEKALCPPTD